MADSRPYTEIERRNNAANAKRAGATNASTLDRASSEDKAADFIRSKGAGSSGPAEPDYSSMGMVERGAARKKWLKDVEEHDKKKAEQAAVRGMK